MTCIIGLEEDGRVYMGGDSCTTAGYETRTIKGKKVFFIGKNAQILVGASGSGRMTQILQYNFKPPPFGTFEAEEYLCKLFVPKLRKAIRKHGYIHTENQTENISENGRFLIGFKGQLFTIYDDFQVHQTEDGLQALGSGREYALGVMRFYQSMAKQNSIASGVIGSPTSGIVNALKIAGYFTGSVAPPYYIEVIK